MDHYNSNHHQRHHHPQQQQQQQEQQEQQQQQEQEHLHPQHFSYDASSTTGTMNDSTEFCQSMGGGMIMYMDGFRFALIEKNQPCLNFLVPSWTLNTRPKFWIAILGTFIFAFVVEGFSKVRHKLVRSAKREYAASRSRRNSNRMNRRHVQNPSRSMGSSGSDGDTNRSSSHQSRRWTFLLLRLSITLLHGFQALCGYLLMLVSMTFSVELLIAVILGLSTGYGAFFDCNKDSNVVGNDDDNDDECNDIRHTTNNPCCEFMEEEGKEIRIKSKKKKKNHNNRCLLSDEVTLDSLTLMDTDNNVIDTIESKTDGDCCSEQKLSRHQHQQPKQQFPNEV